MATEISLCCWIIGLDNANLFPVDIAPSKTVGHLKKLIKKEKEPELDHLAADRLDVWKVKHPAKCTGHC